MKVLLLGSGGREHALAWRLKKDDPDLQLFIAPGNAGTAQLGVNLAIKATDLDGLVAWAGRERPDLTIVGPEAPLCAGVVDRFKLAGLAIFGPGAAAARLEGSKVYAKEVMLRHGLPTAHAARFSDAKAARALIEQETSFPQVLKADGLAAGKGVIIAQSKAEALTAIGQVMEERIFGDAGGKLLIEEFLQGREMSVHVVTDGHSHILLPIAQDHKKLGDGETGSNTGGMGAYAPAPFATPELCAEISRKIVEPTLAAFRKEGIDFRGILFIGIIWTKAGPQILEFNVRGGDPETQVLLPLLETPLIELLQAVCEGRLGKLAVRWNGLRAVSVVMAAEGYPAEVKTGASIAGLEAGLPGTMVFHAGTEVRDGRVCVSGGRVLSVTAWAEDLAEARDLAYRRLAKIDFAGCQYRRDIAAHLTLDEAP